MNPMNRPTTPILVLLCTLALTVLGCSTLTRLTRPLGQAGSTLFTSTRLADLVLVGVKSGPTIPVQATPSPELDENLRVELAQHLGQGPVGLLLPITEVGETTPWWIFCPAGDLQETCEQIPPNARVSFTGQPLGHGTVLLPTRLTWSAR